MTTSPWRKTSVSMKQCRWSMVDATTPCPRLTDVTVTYDRHPAVHHLTGGFIRGEMTAITGPNGAGKSTLLKALMGELPVTAGEIDWGGTPSGEVAYLPQAARIDRSFPMTVADLVLLGAWQETGGFGAVTRNIAERARHALATVNLEGFGRRGLDELSAGQFQRVLFARLLMQEARVILLDEPFTTIDSRTTSELLALVRLWREEGRTVIAVLHDLEQIRKHFPQTLLLARQGIAWGPSEQVLSTVNLQHTCEMAERWDEHARRCDPAPRSLS